MKINATNTKKLQAALDAAQEKSSARNCSIGDIKALVEHAEKYLDEFKIPKKYWKGAAFVYVEYVNCNSYSKGSCYADSTEIKIRRGSSGWFLVQCYRPSLPTSNGHKYYYFIPGEICEKWAKEKLYYAFVDGF